MNAQYRAWSRKKALEETLLSKSELFLKFEEDKEILENRVANKTEREMALVRLNSLVEEMERKYAVSYIVTRQMLDTYEKELR